MEQEIRFCEVDGRRIAYATSATGRCSSSAAAGSRTSRTSGLHPRRARFFEELARTHRVVRYDRLGAGLSDRELRGPPTIESERARSRQCSKRAVTSRQRSSRARAQALRARARERAPERVRKIVFFGGYASRDDIPEATRRSLVDFVRVNWPLAAQMLAGPVRSRAASGDEIAALSRYQRPLGRRRRRRGLPRARPRADLRDASSARHDAGARAAPPRRPYGPDRARPRARVAAPERALRRAGRRLAPAVDGRPA